MKPERYSDIIGRMNARVHIYVSGWVQGVSYRGYARRSARGLGLTGWVRNLYDGRVEAVAEGSRPAVEAFIAWTKEGPPAARVEEVRVVWEDYRGEFTDFLITGLDF